MEHWKILHSAKDLKQKGRNEQRSADVTGSGRNFCDGELNFKKASLDEAFFFYTIKQDTSLNSTSGCESLRLEIDHWTKPAQKDRRKKRVHSVNPFCFVIYFQHSLINHCEERYS